MRYTTQKPKTEGWYWYYDGSEHTPTIVEVKREYSSIYGRFEFWAINDEFCFRLSEMKNGPKEYWCPIKSPKLPKGGT